MNDKNFDSQNIKVVYMGTPDFAVPSLKALYKAGYNITAVVSQPDKKVGRKQELRQPAVKQCALELGIPVLQPEKVRKNDKFISELQELGPDVIIVAAYGKIIPQEILDIPKLGCINVHGSILPEYRGASPIQTAILDGKGETGVTIMLMDIGMDTGDILSIEKVAIDPHDTSESLHNTLADVGSHALVATLEKYIRGEIQPQKQDDNVATYTRMFSKEDGLIDWNKTAQQIYNQYRACSPWPGIYTYFQGKRIKLLDLAFCDYDLSGKEIIPGKVYVCGDRVCIGCAESTVIEAITLQREGKKPTHAKEFIKGVSIEDEILGI